MGVISQISVGDIMYYQVDDIPSHTATKGSVAIMDSSSQYSNGFTYINNDGDTTWLKCISPSYGEISLTNATNIVNFDTQTPSSWYTFNESPAGASWVLDPASSSDWILTTENTGTDDLKYTGSTIMRAVISNSSTIRGGTGKWMSWLTGIVVNFTTPNDGWNESFAADNNSTTNCESLRVFEMSTDDYLLGGISPVSRESGGGAAMRSYISKHCQIIAVKLDEPLILTGSITLVNEDWESNSFATNSWTVINDTTNQWEIGTAQVDTGTYGVYGSNDGGTTADYSGVGDVSHFYKDFTFPVGVSVTLTFRWRSYMENAAGAIQYDYGTVNIIDTTTTPVAGTEVSTALAVGIGNGRVNETGANIGKFNEGYKYGGIYDGTWFTETVNLSAYAGSTKRLVFSFTDDGVAPEDSPAMSIDNILLTYSSGNIY